MLQERMEGPWGEGIAFQEHPVAQPPFTFLYTGASLLGNAHGQPWLTASVTCQPPDDGQPSRT